MPTQYLNTADIKPDIVNVAADTNIYEGNDKVEQQPDLYHLDVRSHGQAGHHRYVHADQDQHDSDVHSYGRLKVERFEIVRDVADDVEQNCWNVNSREDAEQAPTKKNQS